MTAFRRTILTGSAALLLAALLTGCSPASGDATGLIPSAGQGLASETATPTPTAIPGDRDGNGTLSAFEKQILAKSAVHDYTMPDGSVVAIDPTRPLPAEVAEVVKNEAAPDAAALGTATGKEREVQLGNVMSRADAIADATGKDVIFVYPTISATDSLGGYENVWATTASHKDSTGIAAVQSRDAVLADAQNWAGSRGYEVIVFE